MLLFFVAAAPTISRLVLGLTRYFDPDEFAHLHWAYLLAQGNLPYRDFFLYHVPLFQLALLPLFLLPPSPTIIILSRVAQWLLYVTVLLLFYVLSRRVTKSRETGLSAVIIMAVFPMTLDKTIEVRPDVLMVLFFLATVLLLESSVRSKQLLLSAGVLYGLAVLTFPKILFALPSLTILLLSSAAKQHGKMIWENSILFAVGLFIPVLIVIGYLSANNILADALSAIVRSAIVVNTGQGAFSPWLALSPYPLVYVTRGGVSWPWIINTVIWISALGGLVVLWRKSRRIAVFFSLFFAGGFSFLLAFPAPYLQYFLPLSVFASLLSAVFFQWMFQRYNVQTHGRHGSIWRVALTPPTLFLILAFILMSSFFQQYRERTMEGRGNREQLGVIRDVLRISRADETFYDMVGSYVFRPDGYFICCHPYYEFADRLPEKPMRFADSLVVKQTKFIVLDRTGKSLWLPAKEDLAFITSHYLPSDSPKIYTVGFQFRCSSAMCVQTDLNNQPVPNQKANTFSVAIEEFYTVVSTPQHQPVILDGAPAADKPIFLRQGTHSFSVPPTVSALRIQLAR